MGSSTLHKLFLRQARRAPDAPALIGASGSVSYAELARDARALALDLRSRNFDPETLIGVRLCRSPALAASLLGILESGCAFLPLEPRHPQQRVDQILDEARPALLLEEQTMPGAPTDVGNRPWTDPAKPDDLAYVIYTSGSTGKPKGVQITHGAAANTLVNINDICHVGPGDRVLNVSSISFDLSIYDFFGAWAAGACVVLVPDREYPDPRDWVLAMQEAQVTLWNSAPALMEMLLDYVELDLPTRASCLQNLRIVMLSGDRISPRLVHRLVQLQPRVRILAMGGATEAAIWSVHNWVEELSRHCSVVPYGKALRKQRIHVLDSSLDEVAVGKVGELYIGGAGLARGYRNRPDLTAARFIPHPRGAGTRLYATGDRVRRLAGGSTEFLGRVDSQVKIRGFRVEIAEVEHALLQVEGVEQAAVICVQAQTGPQLIGFVVPHRDAPHVQSGYLRERLARSLPTYMIPARLLCQPSLPLSPNGKIDRAQLRIEEAGPREISVQPSPSEAGTESEVLAVWRHVLSLREIHPDEEFLDLGGNSLLAMQIVNRLSETFPVALTMQDLFENPTIASLAALIEERAARQHATA